MYLLDTEVACIGCFRVGGEASANVIALLTLEGIGSRLSL
jgi:hypothetical protein